MAVGPALSISSPGPGWGMGVCLSACLLVLQAEGLGALGSPKIKNSSGYGPPPLPLATTTQHNPQSASGYVGSCLCLVQRA